MYNKTLVKFENEIINEFFATNDTTGFSRKAYMEDYPRGCRLQEWREEVIDAARSGEVISKLVLDDLCRRCGEGTAFRIMHDWPKSVPENYLTVQANQRQKAAHVLRFGR